MDFMPFNDIDNDDFRLLFPVNYDLVYDDEGEWVYCHGHWYLTPYEGEDSEFIERLAEDQDPLDYEDPDADEVYDLEYAAY